jgi:hypothetical protein
MVPIFGGPIRSVEYPSMVARACWAGREQSLLGHGIAAIAQVQASRAVIRGRTAPTHERSRSTGSTGSPRHSADFRIELLRLDRFRRRRAFSGPPRLRLCPMASDRRTEAVTSDSAPRFEPCSA